MKFEHQDIFFISDLHLGHKNIIKYDERPFKDLDEMHTKIIQNWNAVVSPKSIVYFLGDLSLGKNYEYIVHSLNGQKHMIMGNHDHFEDIKSLNAFQKIHEYGTEIKVIDKDSKYGYNQIILSHYPLLVWNKHHYGSWHLHGHCHGSLISRVRDYYKRKVLDVGCNVIDHTPISYQQVKNIMDKREITYLDHHTSNTNP